MRYFVRVLTAVLVVVAMTTVGVSKAQADFITSLGQIQQDGTYDWGSLAAPGSSIGTSFTTGGLTGMPGTGLYGVSTSLVTGFEITQQGFGWGGSFANGENLLRNRGDGSYRLSFVDPLTYDPTPVAGFGTYYQDASRGLTSVRFSVYDINDVLLGTRDFSHIYPNPPIPGTAEYGGFLSDQRNIAYVDMFDLRPGISGSGEGFAIGDFHVQRVPVMTPVPEPASIVILGIGAGVLAIGRAVRRKRNPDAETTVAA